MDFIKYALFFVDLTVFWSSYVNGNFAAAAGVRIRLIGNVGEITSPNYPSKYPLNSSIVWTVATDEGKRIRLKFIDFQVERAKRCIYDSVQIREDFLKPWNDVEKLCGITLPPDYITKGTSVQIRFKSDALNVVEKGFKLQWNAIDIQSTPCTEVKKTVTKASSCIPQPAKTKIRIVPCPTPVPGSKNDRSCNCAGTAKGTSPKGSGVSYTSGPQSVGSNRGNDTDTHGPGKVEYVGSEDTVMIATFSALLTLFIIICIGLVVALWRRRKEIDELRQYSRSKSPEFDWVPYMKDSVKASNGCNGHGYEQVPTTRVGPDEVRTIDSLNRHLLRIKSEQLAQPFAQQTRRSNQETYTALLPQIVRTGNQHSVSSCDDAEEETSDIYVSSDVSGTGVSIGRCHRSGRVAV